MTSPVKLAHVVLQTTDVARLRDWWATVLDAEVIWQNDGLCFLSYDDEHHRIAIAAPPGVTGPVDKSVAGLHHVAFTYDGLDDLVGVYERSEGSRHRSHVVHQPRADVVVLLRGSRRQLGGAAGRLLRRAGRRRLGS